MKYKVAIYETFCGIVYLDASSEEEAEEEARRMYFEGAEINFHGCDLSFGAEEVEE